MEMSGWRTLGSSCGRSRKTIFERVPVSALLACGAVHHHLVAHAKRTRLGIVVETGEAREVHHHCLLVGYGADAINPWLAFESLWQAREDGLLEDDTRVWFQMYGANLNLDADGKVDSVADGPTTLEFYFAACEAQGLPRPNPLVE